MSGRRHVGLGQRYEWSLPKSYANEKLLGTCSWITKEDTYRRWFSGERPSCLWIQGQLGAGKTTLCSYIVDNLVQTKQGNGVLYCFVSSKHTQSVETAIYVLDGLICQLVRKGNQTASRSKLLSIQKSIDILQSQISADVFRNYLVMILDTLEPQARLVVALDGLQKDEWIANALVHEILEANTWRSRSTQIRCIVTSRNPHGVILHYDHISSIDMSRQTGVQQDIFLFAKSRLAFYTQTTTEDGALVENIARQLCIRANGCFLWVQLVTEVQDRDGQLEKLLKDLDTIPSTLQGLYAIMLQMVPAGWTSTVQNIFSWLLAAIRPLKLGELLEALVIEPDCHRASVSGEYTIERLGLRDPKSEIPQMCGMLVRNFQK